MSKTTEKVSRTIDNMDEIKKQRAIQRTTYVPSKSYNEIIKEEEEKRKEEEKKLHEQELATEITDQDIMTLKKTLKSLKENVQILENNWNTTRTEFKVTDSQVKQVYQFNEQNRDSLPDGASEEDEENFDHFNGVDKMTEEDIKTIFGEFGEDNPIIGIDINQTKDRIKQVLADFFYWLSAMREYTQADISYMHLMEIKEEQYMIKMRMEMINAEDEKTKTAAEEAINNYYYYKYLKYLAEPMDEKTINKLVEAFGDEQKIKYWINRSREKLNQAGLNPKIILEMSQFEKKFLEEKYHCISNALLLLFVNITTFTDMGNKNDSNNDRKKVLTFVTSMDSVIRNYASKDVRDIILDNIRAYLDQVLEPMKAAYPVEVGGEKL